MVHLPLPVQWHVHSLASKCNFSLSIPEIRVNMEYIPVVVHQEKNWASSFPKAHMWLQAHSHDRLADHTHRQTSYSTNASNYFLTRAGGHVFGGLEALILTFRNRSVDITLRPPLTLALFGFSPFVSTHVDWNTNFFAFTYQTLRTKLSIRATAPKDSFFNLSAPFPEGHRSKALAQSLRASVYVEVWRREGWLSLFGLGGW